MVQASCVACTKWCRRVALHTVGPGVNADDVVHGLRGGQSPGVDKRGQRRSKYGAKRPKK